MYGQTIPIDETLKVVCSAMSRAETTMRTHIKRYYRDANEEFVTSLFYGHINYHLRKASRAKTIEQAFLRDLETAAKYELMTNWGLKTDLGQAAAGLVADIILHNKRQEGKTAGDFGLVIVHPEIESGNNFLVIKKGLSSGLLCQAKMKDRNGKWPKFTKAQKNLLPNRLEYTSLVLYSYLDDGRRQLDSINWKLCKGYSFDEIDGILKKDEIDHPQMTTSIITSLGRKEIGTNDQALIESIISPANRQSLEIRIHWREDPDQKESIRIRTSERQVEREKVSVRLHNS